MRIVRITVEAPRTTTAWTPSTSFVEAVQAAAVKHDELAHVHASPLPTGVGVVVFLLVPLDQAAATGCRLVLAATDSLGLHGWTLGSVEVWDPGGFS